MTLGELVLIYIKMAFMVKNPGLMPGFDSLRDGDVTKRRKAMWDVLVGGWRACEYLALSQLQLRSLIASMTTREPLETET